MLAVDAKNSLVLSAKTTLFLLRYLTASLLVNLAKLFSVVARTLLEMKSTLRVEVRDFLNVSLYLSRVNILTVLENKLVERTLESSSANPTLAVTGKLTVKFIPLPEKPDADSHNLTSDEPKKPADTVFDARADTEGRRLPAGWERRITPEGRSYYVDHNTRSTSWISPSRESRDADASEIQRPSIATSLSQKASSTELNPMHDDPLLANLMVMGYSRADAVEALERYDYNLERVSPRLALESSI